MAAKKKAKKKAAKSRTTRKKAAIKSQRRSKKLTKVKASSKRPVKKKASARKQTRRRSERVVGRRVLPESLESRSGEQSGDLQGLSRIEGADSESVDELLEEGNAFEADVVLGVENAGTEEGREVRTHEVPEDDVPGEYLDKD
jgi:hypothetical protein